MAVQNRYLAPSAQESSRRRFMRILCFVVAFMCIVSASYVYTFAAYLNALKATFQYTQTQVEFVMSMCFVGLGGTFPAGLFVQKFGVRAGGVLGLILPSASYLLIWSATRNPDYYHDNQYLLAFYYFIGGVGSGAIYITGMTVCLQNFSERYHGRISGGLITGYNIGVLFYIYIYEYFFMGGHIEDPENQNLGGFFLFTAACSAVVNAISPFVYGHYPSPTEVSSEEVFLTEAESTEWRPGMYSEESHETADTKDELSICQLLRNKTYHYLIWPVVIMIAFEPVNVGNLTTYLYSFGLEEYQTTLPYVSPGLSFVLKLLVGWMSDLWLHRIHRIWYVLFASCFKIFTYLLGMFLIDRLVVLVLDLVLWDVSVVFVICNMPALIAEEFGAKRFATTWGLSYFATALLVFALENAFGILYDLYTIEGDTVCYGLMCFAWSFVIGIALSIVAVCCNVMYIRERNIEWCWDTEEKEEDKQ